MRFTASFAVLGALLGLASAAGAEGFVDVYGGGVFTSDDQLSFGGDSLPFAINTEADFKNTGVVGARAGYWLDPLPFLGFAADISWFRPDVRFGQSLIPGVDVSGQFDFHVIPISLMALARIPICATDEMPGGRIAPYGGIGLGIFTSVFDGSTTATAGGTPLTFETTAAAVNVGLDARAGLNVQITKLIGVFTEYRYTRYDLSIDTRTIGGLAGLGDIDFNAKSTIESNHIVGGIAFRF